MDIPLVSSLPLGSIGSIGPLINRAPAAAIAPALSPLPPSLTTVDLSPLGRFLSAASLFQKKMLELQVAASTITESQAREFGDILASSATLAVAFNELQANDIGGTDVDGGSLDQQSLATLFAQQLAARTAADGGDAATALASLASIGLSFGPGPLGAGENLTVDLPLLQVALEVDPATTGALLSRAGAAFGALVQADVQAADLSAEPPQETPAPAAPASAPAPGAAGAPSRDDVFLQELITGNSEASRPAAPATAQAGIVLPNEAAASAAALQAQEAFVRASESRTAPVAVPANSGAGVQEQVNISSNAAPAENKLPAEQALADRAIALASNERTQSASEDERAALSDAIDTRDRQNLANARNTAAAQAEDNALASNQAAAANANRILAEQALSERAAALAANERSLRANQQERFALREAVEGQDRLTQANLTAQDRIDEQRRLQDVRTAQQRAADDTPAALTTAAAISATIARNAQQTEEVARARAQPPQPGLRDQALQAARDPAIAAAIAAYSLNTGAFAALNVRQELAAPRTKSVPAVSGVSKVSAVDSATEPKAGTP